MVRPAETSETRWNKVLNRDAKADGQFVFAVVTTGIYCRPSCPARHAKRQNVRFFDTAEQAEQAGFRPCLRCRPDDKKTLLEQYDERYSQLVLEACRYIDSAQGVPSLAEIARAVGTGPSHLHRLFKSVLGISPKNYADQQRATKMRTIVENADTSITEAIYEAGYSSSSRFYDRSKAMFGMTATAYRAGGNGLEIRYATGQSALGAVLVAASDKGIVAILLGDDGQALVQDLERRFPRARLMAADNAFASVVADVIRLVEKPARQVDLPLDLQGTAFQQRVWQALRTIPAGETISYSELAERIGAPKSARAVAQACAANKIAVAVPCHRVVRNDGGISGYRWGVERKQELLQRERDD